MVLPPAGPRRRMTSENHVDSVVSREWNPLGLGEIQVAQSHRLNGKGKWAGGSAVVKGVLRGESVEVFQRHTAVERRIVGDQLVELIAVAEALHRGPFADVGMPALAVP